MILLQLQVHSYYTKSWHILPQLFIFFNSSQKVFIIVPKRDWMDIKKFARALHEHSGKTGIVRSFNYAPVRLCCRSRLNRWADTMISTKTSADSLHWEFCAVLEGIASVSPFVLRTNSRGISASSTLDFPRASSSFLMPLAQYGSWACIHNRGDSGPDYTFHKRLNRFAPAGTSHSHRGDTWIELK